MRVFFERSQLGPIWRPNRLLPVAILLSFTTQLVSSIQLNFTTVHQAAPEQTNRHSANDRLTSDDLIVASLSNSSANWNSSGEQLGESGSILRPQLAVQIYTTLNGTKSEQPRQPVVGLKRKRPGKSESYLQASASNTQHDYQDQIEQQNNVWQYETIGDNFALGGQQRPSVEASSALSDNTFTVASPMINAIISIPSGLSYNQRDRLQMEANNEEVDYQAPNYTNNASSANVERAISRLIDSQASGNVEFSMSMNGDEMVINPVSRQAAKMLASSLAQRDIVADNVEPIERGRLSAGAHRFTTHMHTRAPRRHASAAQNNNNNNDADADDNDDDEPSASETENLINGKSEDERTNYGEQDSLVHNQSNDFEQRDGGQQQQPSSAAKGERRLMRATDRRRQDSAYLASKVARRGKASAQRTPPVVQDTSDSDLDPDSEEGDEQLEGGDNFSLASDERPKSHAGLTARRDNEDAAPRWASRTSAAARGTNRVRTRRRGKFYSGADSQTQPTQRHVQRNSAEQAQANRSRSGAKQPTVVLRGEDAKRFEQLLDNLKSLSVLNLNSNGATNTGGSGNGKAGPKIRLAAATSLARARNNEHSHKEAPSSRRATNSNDEADNQMPASRNRWTAQGNELSSDGAQDQGEPPVSRSSAEASKRSLEARLGDCERNSKRHESTLASGNSRDDDDDGDHQRRAKSSSEPASSSHEISLESELSSDASDDLNDTDGSNAVEQQEERPSQTSDTFVGRQNVTNHLQQDHSSQLVASRPQAIFVRKTILQSYYDRSSDGLGDGTSGSQSESDADGRKESNLLHNGHLSESNGDGELVASLESSTPNKSDKRVHDDSSLSYSKQQADNNQQGDKLEKNLNSYIDYDKLDDRDVYRGSESRKVRVHSIQQPGNGQQQQQQKQPEAQNKDSQAKTRLESLQQAIERVSQRKIMSGVKESPLASSSLKVIESR